jgi:hypothetical protein
VFDLDVFGSPHSKAVVAYILNFTLYSITEDKIKREKNIYFLDVSGTIF